MSPISGLTTSCALASHLKQAAAFDEDSDTAQSAAVLLTYLGGIYLSPNGLEESDFLQLQEIVPEQKRAKFSAGLRDQCAHCVAKENCHAGQIILKHCIVSQDQS